MPKTMIVIPTYNEAINLPLIMEALFSLSANFEVLIVDDNSPDGTGQIAENLSKQYGGCIHVLHRKGKNGFGPAYIAGFKRALEMGADYIIQMDADLSHQPKYIPQMLDAIKTCDVVVGSRFIKGGGVDPSWGWHRKMMSLWANRIYTPTILRMPIFDATGGYRAWRRATLIGMDLDRIQSNGYVFQIEMIYVAFKLGFRWQELPIFFPDRQHGESKMSPEVALEAATRVWRLLWRYRHLDPSKRVLEKRAETLAPAES